MINCVENNVCSSCRKNSSCRILEKIAPLYSELDKIPGIELFFDLEKCHDAARNELVPLEKFLV